MIGHHSSARGTRPPADAPASIDVHERNAMTFSNARLQAPRTLEFEDIYRIAVPGDPQLAPDGGGLLFTVQSAHRAEDAVRRAIWAIRSHDDGQLLDDGGWAPRWAPGGATFAYLKSVAGAPQLFAMSADGGASRQLTSLPDGAGTPVWSPDGAHLAFVAPGRQGSGALGSARAKDPLVVNRLGYKADGVGYVGDAARQLHVYDHVTGEVVQLTEGYHSVTNPVWSPDGHRIAFGGAAPDSPETTPISTVFVASLDGKP